MTITSTKSVDGSFVWPKNQNIDRLLVHYLPTFVFNAIASSAPYQSVVQQLARQGVMLMTLPSGNEPARIDQIDLSDLNFLKQDVVEDSWPEEAPKYAAEKYAVKKGNPFESRWESYLDNSSSVKYDGYKLGDKALEGESKMSFVERIKDQFESLHKAEAMLNKADEKLDDSGRKRGTMSPSVRKQTGDWMPTHEKTESCVCKASAPKTQPSWVEELTGMDGVEVEIDN